MIILNSEFGADTCRTTLNYIIVVLGKYLLMAVAWSIHKGNLDGVEEDFAKFNNNFYQLVQDFSKVTGEEFMSGFEDEQSNSLKGIDNYRGSPPYADFGTWKKPCYMKFVLVGLYCGPLLTLIPPLTRRNSPRNFCFTV